MYKVLLLVLIIMVLPSCGNNEIDTVNYTDKEVSMEESSSEQLEDNRADYSIQFGDTLINLNDHLYYKDIAGLKKEDLSILRNAYYAKYGYMFENTIYSDYFLSCTWYEPSHSDAEKYLLTEDRLNINILLKVEERWNSLYGDMSEDEKNLIGMWQHHSAGVGSGFSDLYFFNEDRSFTFKKSEMDGENRLVSSSGSWYILDNELHLYIKIEEALEGGELVASGPSMGTTYEIRGAELVKIQHVDPSKTIYILDFDQTDLKEKDFCFGVFIDNEAYYNLETRINE